MYVSGFPRLLLRLEGLIVVILSLYFFNELQESWWLFAILFLAPDLSFLGYVAGEDFGSVLYNIAHTYLLPSGLALLGLMLHQPLLYSIALVWTAHIGADRLVGYGLKYSTGFSDTHLGRIGKARPEEIVGQ